VKSVGAALDALDARAADVEARLEALKRGSVPYRKGAASFLADLSRCRKDRAAVRRLLGLLPGPAASAPQAGGSLRDLRAAQQELVFAHAEGIPSLSDARAVALLVPDLLDVARHIAVVDLWLEAEDRNG
jgi:hypothetical protein